MEFFLSCVDRCYAVASAGSSLMATPPPLAERSMVLAWVRLVASMEELEMAFAVELNVEDAGDRCQCCRCKDS